MNIDGPGWDGRSRVATNVSEWNCIAIGETTGRPELAETGYAMLDQWLAYTWECGIHEYISPTYYGTDLDSLGLPARHTGREGERDKAEVALKLFWADIAANWFAPCERLGTRTFRRMGEETICLLSQLVLPSAVGVYTGRGEFIPASRARPAIPRGTPVFLRYADVAVAVRILVAQTTQGTPVPLELVRDGAKWQAMRLTCTHSATRPERTGFIVLCARAEGFLLNAPSGTRGDTWLGNGSAPCRKRSSSCSGAAPSSSSTAAKTAPAWMRCSWEAGRSDRRGRETDLHASEG